jgi:hypothetical protein
VNSDYVTIEEAETRLAEVRELLDAARRTKREIESIAASYDYDSVLIEAEKDRLKPLAVKLNDCLEALEMHGCYVKDLDIGLVDFLSTFEGRDIFLCWKLGEEHICHWHELDEGFANRQEILNFDELFLAECEFETPIVENEN